MCADKVAALQCAVRLLARREHSQHELGEKLAARGYSEQEINVALHRLLEKDLQNDERFTQAYTMSRRQRGHGPCKIIAELKQRGIDESLADQIMCREQFDWDEHALRVYRKQYAGKLASCDDERAKRRRFLRQRGFSGEQIKYATSAGKAHD